MRKVISILCVLTLLFMVGCSKKEAVYQVYRGENESWTAEYKITGTEEFTKKDGSLGYENALKKVLTVTYKKDIKELSSLKYLEISYESSVAKGKITDNFTDAPPKQKIYTCTSGGSSIAKENKEDIITVSINLDGKIQEIRLKNIDH